MENASKKTMPEPITESEVNKLINTGDVCLLIWASDGTIVDISLFALSFFGVQTKEDFHKNFDELSPKYQPNGKRSKKALQKWVSQAFLDEISEIKWLHKKFDGRLMDCKITFQPATYGENQVICALITEATDKKSNLPITSIKEATQSAYDRVHVMLNAVPVGCWLYSSSGKVIDVNQHAVDMFEMKSKGEMNRSTVEECLPKYQPTGETSMDYFQRIFIHAAEYGMYKGQITVMSKSGRVFACEITNARVEYGGDYAIMASLREADEDYEFTRQMKAERAVQQRLQAMTDSSPLCTFIMDQEFRVVDCNQVAVTLFEFRDKPHFIESVFEIAHQYQETPVLKDGTNQDGTVVLNKLHEAFTAGYSQFEWTARTLLSKKAIPTEFTAVRVRLEGKDYVIIYVRDLTEFHRYKLAEQMVQDRLQSMLDSSPLVCAVFSKDYKILEVNKAAISLFEIPNERDYLDRLLDLCPKIQPDGIPTAEKIPMIINNAFEHGSATLEWMHNTVKGEPIPCELFLRRVSLGDKQVVIVHVRDLRKEKEMLAKIENAFIQEQLANQAKARIEVAEESNRAKSRFLARMSHEIRTPITAVLGISEIQLQNPNLSEQVVDSFLKIHNSSHILLGVVNDILDLSRIEAGKMTLLYEDYKTSDMIVDVTSIHLANFDDTHVKFDIFVDENLPETLVGDPLRVAQIMNNLISNAIKYTKSGGIDVGIFCEPIKTRPSHVMLVISIRDTGMGMTPEQVETLFSDYTRFHEEENRFINGTGLGMPIVYNLVQLMDATIDLQSEAGKGTNIEVRIPQKMMGTELIGKETAQKLQQFEADAFAMSQKVKFVPEPMPYGSVLIVDDIDANLYVAQGLLAFYDLNIEVCSSGYEAIEKIEKGKKYDIIFMDYMMPGMNGTEAMRELRKLGYSAPIVALTANALIGQAEEFIRQGFDGFISKPIHTKNLNSALNKHIRDKQPPEVIEAARAAGKNAVPNKSEIGNYLNNTDVMTKLRLDFVRKHKNTAVEIVRALEEGNTKHAHLLSHSLKGLAGLIQEPSLAKISGEIEHMLKAGNMPTKTHLAELENEMNTVLGGIDVPEPSIGNGTNGTFDKDRARVLFDKLKPLLETRNTECLSLLNELREFPETAILTQQIQDFDFTVALKNLGTLREIWGV